MNNRQKAEMQKNKATELIWSKPADSTLVERWFLLDEACRLYENEPQPLAMGKGLCYILEHASLPIDECDLLLGRYDDRVPTPEEQKRLEKIWETRVKQKNPITRYNQGHLTLDWEQLVKIGIVGYLDKAERAIRRAESDKKPQKELDYLVGMKLTYEAIGTYIARYGEQAERSGNAELAAACKRLTVSAPKTFREALQLVLFVFTVYMIYAGWRVACLTLGRMDRYLLPFYLNDLKTGEATEEDIACLIDDFSCKTSLHLGRGEHQMASHSAGGNTTGWNRNHVYDSPTYIVIGGVNEEGCAENALTLLFAKAITPEMKNPVYIYRWSKKRSDEVWSVICEKIRSNSSILLYNDETMIPAMRGIGVDSLDAVNYTVHPCNWPDIAGGYAEIGKIGSPIPEMLLQSLLDGNGNPRSFSSTEEIYEAFRSDYKALVNRELGVISDKISNPETAFTGRLRMADCFIEGPMDRICSSMDGGIKYPSVYMLVRNIGTAADMMAAIDELVFKKGKLSLAELLGAAKTNFEGQGEILAMCRRCPKYGTDNDEVDSHAVRLMSTMLDVIDGEFAQKEGKRKLYPLCVTITDMEHIINGQRLPATPDGRLAGEPLSENLSPTVGYFDSVTALLNSVSKLPFDRIHSGVLNVRMRSDLVGGEDGLMRLSVLMDTYFERGGIQMQVSIADTATLRKAQRNPEAYCDLRVRITGYSAVFVDMSKSGQEEIIRRDELG